MKLSTTGKLGLLIKILHLLTQVKSRAQSSPKKKNLSAGVGKGAQTPAIY